MNTQSSKDIGKRAHRQRDHGVQRMAVIAHQSTQQKAEQHEGGKRQDDGKIGAHFPMNAFRAAQGIGKRIDEQIAQHGQQDTQRARRQQRVHHTGIGFCRAFL